MPEFIYLGNLHQLSRAALATLDSSQFFHQSMFDLGVEAYDSPSNQWKDLHFLMLSFLRSAHGSNLGHRRFLGRLMEFDDVGCAHGILGQPGQGEPSWLRQA